MKNLMGFEIKKVTNSFSFLGAALIAILVICGIFFTGFHYSQLSLSEKSNEVKGVKGLYWEVSGKNTGVFDDTLVKSVMSDYIERYQSKPVEKRPFDLFSSNIADAFFPSDEDVYLQMNGAMKDGKAITINQIHLSTIEDVGFQTFKKPLLLGNYVPWNDLYKVSGSIFILVCVISILVCSLIFSGDASKNINQLLFSTKYGRTKLTVAKILAATIINIAIYIVFIFTTFIAFLIYNRGIAGWDASIQTNFSLKLFSFPLQMNNLNIWLLVLMFYCFGILAIVGVTLLISSLTKSPYIALAMSIGIFILPLALTYIFKTGIINKLLYLFPINNYDVEKMLTIMSSRKGFIFKSFVVNFSFTVFIMFFLMFASSAIIYMRINRKKDIGCL